MALNQPIQNKKPNQVATGYTNIQRILQANKQNRLGQTVASGVQQAGQAAQGAIGQAGQQFQNQVMTENQRLASEKDRASRVLGNVSGASQEDINAFEGIRGGQSKGPTNVQNADEIRNKALEAERLGSAGGSEAGRYGLLQRYVGGNKAYTGGQQRLDSMLLGQTGADQLRAAKKDTLGLMNKAATQEAGATEVGKVLQNKAKDLSQTTIKALEGQVVDYDKAMEAARVKAEEDRAARQAADIEQLKSGQIYEQDIYDSLGLTEGHRMYGTDLSQFYQGLGKDLATKENVQTQADFDKISALRKLSGNSLTGEASAILPNYTDQGQIGAYDKMADFSYNKDALKGAVENARLAYGQGNVGAMAHIQESLRGLYGTNISDAEHERQLREYGTSARESNFQRQYWAGGGYGDTALGVDPGFRAWMLDTYVNDPRYMGGQRTTASWQNTLKGLQPAPTAVTNTNEDENA